MLKLSIKPGEYLLIGEDVKVIFTGGSANNLRLLIDAPKSCKVTRSAVLEKYSNEKNGKVTQKYHKDRDISPEAREKILAILMEDRKNAKLKTGNNERQHNIEPSFLSQ